MCDAYGGVIFNDRGEVLLRRPTGHFGGTVWTFAKGQHEHGSEPEETALREVEEETGYRCEIVSRIPGKYRGSTSVTAYFVMRPIGERGAYDEDETCEVRWVTPEAAVPLIMLTKLPITRARDLRVLRKATEVFHSLPGTGS